MFKNVRIKKVQISISHQMLKNNIGEKLKFIVR